MTLYPLEARRRRIFLGVGDLLRIPPFFFACSKRGPKEEFLALIPMMSFLGKCPTCFSTSGMSKILSLNRVRFVLGSGSESAFEIWSHLDRDGEK
jgi:hypothetical protein